MKASNGKYFGQTQDANDLKHSTSTYKNTISMNADGTVNIVSGGAYLRFNANSGQNRFRYYKSTTYTAQKAICLYKKEADLGTRYYSTLDAVIPCVHENCTTSTVDATCIIDGSVTVKCDDCGEVISVQVIPAQGHQYFYACDAHCMICGELTNPNAAHVVEHTAESCYNTEFWSCTLCGGYWADEALTLNTNRMNVIKGVPTHTAEHTAESCYNSEYWYCASCDTYFADEALTQITNRMNVIKGVPTHELTHVAAVAPTCYAEGNVEHWYCTACETVWTDEALTQISNHKSVILPKAQATWFGVNVELGGELALNFALDVTQLGGVTGNYIVLTHTYADGTTDTITIAQSEWVMSGKYAIVSYIGLAAKEMGDMISAVLYDAQGNAISEAKTDSIETYALRMLKDGVKNEANTLFVDMLNYGAAAQVYFGYNAENLVNAKLTAEQASWASEAPAITNHRVSSGCYYGSALDLEEKIYLQFAFKAAYEEGMKAVVTFTNHYDKLVEQEVNVDVSGSYVTVSVEEMAIADFGTMVTCTLYSANGTELGAVTDSVESYSARMGLGNLGDTIAKLGASAYAFFH